MAPTSSEAQGPLRPPQEGSAFFSPTLRGGDDAPDVGPKAQARAARPPSAGYCLPWASVWLRAGGPGRARGLWETD